jgi:hypothetical protein
VWPYGEKILRLIGLSLMPLLVPVSSSVALAISLRTWSKSKNCLPGCASARKEEEEEEEEEGKKKKKKKLKIENFKKVIKIGEKSVSTCPKGSKERTLVSMSYLVQKLGVVLAAIKGLLVVDGELQSLNLLLLLFPL